MAELVELHIWMQNKSETWEQADVVNPHSGRPQPGQRIILDVEEGTSVPELKVSIAKILEQYKDELMYYYVVAAMRRDDGSMGYRTIVRKVDFEAKKRRRKKKIYRRMD